MNIKLLIVDDEEYIRETFARHFRSLGYDVETADNGKSALEFMSSNKVDIVITDIMMPEMDGVEFTRRVRDEYPLVRKIVVSGYVTLTNAMATMQNGADALLPKPLEDLKLLEDAVERSAIILQGWVNQLAVLTISKSDSRWSD